MGGGIGPLGLVDSWIGYRVFKKKKNLNTLMIHNSRYQVKNQKMKVGVGPIDKTNDLKIENSLVSFEVI